MTVIHIGDGRYVVHNEGALFPPPPPRNRKKLKRKKRRKAKPDRVVHRSRRRPLFAGENHPYNQLKAKIQGYKAYKAYQLQMGAKYGGQGRKVGDIVGLTRLQIAKLMVGVHKQVKKDMENIKKEHPNLDAIASEALEGALTVLRGPQNQSTKLQAAKLLLEFTKSKPVAKQDITVNAAEAWLASLADKDE